MKKMNSMSSNESIKLTVTDFKNLDLNSLKHLMGTFMPIVWINDTNYLLGTVIK